MPNQQHSDDVNVHRNPLNKRRYAFDHPPELTQKNSTHSSAASNQSKQEKLHSSEPLLQSMLCWVATLHGVQNRGSSLHPQNSGAVVGSFQKKYHHTPTSKE